MDVSMNSTIISLAVDLTTDSFGYFNINVINSKTNDSTAEEILISNWQIITLILPYSVIFLLAIIGNALVIITLGANRRMRSVTNMFLLNLAVSDLLLGVFCMPFTLVGVLLKQFIFGSLMCSLIPYLQAVSVGVSVWTLVVMSVERYYAICHPLKSRESRQTLSHAYRMIGLVWLSSLITMTPIAVVSELKVIGNTEKFKCRESWPSEGGFEAFTLFLDFALLIVPLVIMSLTYSMISLTLRNNLNNYSRGLKDQCSKRDNISNNSTGSLNKRTANGTKNHINDDNGDNSIETQVLAVTVKERPKVTALRSNTNSMVAEAKQRRVIKMLFVVVLEFFICWTPIYTINTITIYSPRLVYKGLGYNGISFFHLLAFFSSCTNPITYCFMNSKFRQSFLQLFRCRRTASAETSMAFQNSYIKRNGSKLRRAEKTPQKYDFN